MVEKAEKGRAVRNAGGANVSLHSASLAPGSAAASAHIKMLTNDGKLLINSLFLPVIRSAAIGNSGSRHGHLLFRIDRGTVTSVIGAVLN